MSNVYYSPEKYGLTIVGEVKFSSGAYEFDTSVVWRDESGALYYADDSGCSCPIPFDDLGRDGLTKVERLQDLIDYFEKRKTDSYYYDAESDPDNAAAVDAAVGELVTKAGAR